MAKFNYEKFRISSALSLMKGYYVLLRRMQNNKNACKKLQTNKKSVKYEKLQSAFKNRIRTGIIINISHKDPKKFLKECQMVFQRRIKNVFKTEQAVKVNTCFCGEFKVIKGGEELDEYKYLNTKNEIIFGTNDIKQWFTKHVEEVILKELEEFQEKDSGWALSAIIHLNVNINKYTAQLGSSYIELPLEINKKKACINVRNSDNACFAWAVVAALFPVIKDPQRINKYPNYATVLNLTGIQFPMTIQQIPRFEKQNNLSINVYILKKIRKKFTVLPTSLTKDKKEKHINLLLIQNKYFDEENDNQNIDENNDIQPICFHYVLIKNLSRLLSSQLSKNTNKKYFCDRCLHYFYSKVNLDNHIIDCANQNNCKIRLPKDFEKYLKFKNFKNKEKTPFVIYADLECLLEQINNKNKYQRHVPCSIGYYVKCNYDSTLSHYKSFRGEKCVNWFVNELKTFAENLETVFLCALPMNKLSEQEQMEFTYASFCHICEIPFTENDKKVRDHCHLTGVYRGAAHDQCNLRFIDSHIVPVIFHNLTGYDSHFIIKSISSDLEGRVDLLPINKERYISFTKTLDEHCIKFRFIDSFRFMASSLEDLSNNLTSFPILDSEFSHLPEYKINLLKRKGIYPYDYFDEESKFSETTLPDISKFYNKLNDSFINEEDYLHAQKIWSEFKVQNLGEYSDIYLKTDILLLADSFEQFRKSCFETYSLDPAYYFTLPAYAWDVMLKYTSIELELITDIDILMFIERGIRGGLSQCSKRYSIANNKYDISSYDSSKPSKFLIYNDINNQYGWAMSQPLPYGGFEWLNNFEDLNMDNLYDDSPIGYILEVDLEYPKEIHNLHKDLPFCPEHTCPPESKEKKLMGTLISKTKYIIHYRNLKQALKHGLKLTKIHRILQFNQSSWLKSYIDLNTKLRTSAKTEFDKNLFKLMNNAVFGKTMENVRKYSNVKLVTKWFGRYGAEALISKPEFKASTIFNENLVSIELNKTEIFFNKPIYVGMCILDLAKTTLYNFHYEYMIPRFDSNCSILYTDTDSLIYEIFCSDLYEIIKEDCHKYYDTSDYPIENIWQIPQVNKKVLGFMKDENNGRIMTEFVGLRSKMYAIRIEGKDAVKKSKGVKRAIVKNKLTFNDYVECLNSKAEKTIEQCLITSQMHEVSSIIQSKTALSPFDNKRYLIKDSYETLPWGHYNITNVD